VPAVRNLVERPVVAKLIRYSMTSVVGVVLGQSLLQLFYSVLDWPAVPSNVLATAISTGPVYLINRYWVWKKKSGNSLRREVVPFWGMTFLGLALSSLIVWFVEQRTDAALAISVANLSGFGLLWVAKFIVLDRVLFAHNELGETPPPLI
jgi:putative flippase GtrA